MESLLLMSCREAALRLPDLASWNPMLPKDSREVRLLDKGLDPPAQQHIFLSLMIQGTSLLPGMHMCITINHSSSCGQMRRAHWALHLVGDK